MTTSFSYDIKSKIRPECLQKFQNWTIPNGDEIKEALREARLSAEAFSQIIGVEGRSVRRWTGNEVDIPYASWCLLCLEADLGKFWGRSDNILR